ncbi:MAG: aspartate-semialdehyde dehydrogenase [Pseudomonadota bacterium]
MLRVGFIGWRGLVGSVLTERMLENDDFTGLETGFFSTSNPGGPGPDNLGFDTGTLADANDVEALRRFDALISCQGGDYTKAIHPKLRAAGWDGYWIDAASALRMDPASVLALDPVNGDHIRAGLAAGKRDFCGANCTVSLMLMGLAGLFEADLVEWMSSMTYQAASGAGAAGMLELARQMQMLGDDAGSVLNDPNATALAVDRAISASLESSDFPIDAFGVPLAASLIPWIDSPMADGQTREEWKAQAEGNKILGNDESPIPMDGICVRVGAMRCHSQAFMMKLKKPIGLDEVTACIDSAHEWSGVVANTPEETRKQLSPAAVTGSLNVPVGRVRKLAMGAEYLGAFSVGDQLLWGAAEPLRRMLTILREHLKEAD